jgi:type IV pilus assembly protein PilY1
MKERVSADGRNSLDQIRPLWEAGEKLWNRSFSSRIIYGVDENGDLSSFKSTNKDSFDSLLGTNATLFPDCLMDGSDISYTNLIDFVRGKHISGCRNREIDGNTWKLGDIVYSTPLTVDYYNSTMVYVAANDGMLHAFRLGKIRALYSDLQKAQLCQSRGDCGVDKLGSEEWAFLPKDVMPYLRFQAQSDYNHMYLHDMRPYLIEYEDSSGDVRKILIGGMRFGGACGTGDIKPPNDTAPVGRSAYYALDITDPQSPEYLWSFSPDNLGFSYSGPAYIKRKNDDPLVDKEWNRYVMFASGPNDYDGTSDQSLRIYTVDLLEGPSGYNCTIGPDEPDLANLNNAFGGRLFTDGLDVNKDGQTDFVLLGYTSKADDLSGMNGGVLKIYTGPVDGDEVKPANWDYEAFLGSSVQAPITASIKSMACFPDEIDFPYLYFGTGRYFIPNDDASKKDNHFFGVPFVYNATNKRIAGSSNISQIGDSSSMTCSALEDVNESPNSGSWKIPLRSAEGSYLRERCYSEATITDLNIISFNTAQPTAAVCGFGGRTWPWAINCATGRSIEYGLCEHGKYTVDEKDKEAFAIFVQTSTGAVSKRTSGDFDTSGRSKNPIAGTPSPDSSLFVPKGGSDLDILYWREW